MGKNKMIAKSCPKCEMQVAVASKSCKCGHIFFSARRAAEHLGGGGAATITGGVGVASDDIRRRTSRVRRAQPQFYDSQQYQKQTRRVRSPKKRSLSESVDESYKTKDKERGASRARRRRALRRGKDGAASPQRGISVTGDKQATVTATATYSDTAAHVPLRPTQVARAALILHEINRKMRAVVWQPTGDNDANA